jgi:hypothetical protein
MRSALVKEQVGSCHRYHENEVSDRRAIARNSIFVIASVPSKEKRVSRRVDGERVRHSAAEPQRRVDRAARDDVAIGALIHDRVRAGGETSAAVNQRRPAASIAWTVARLATRSRIGIAARATRPARAT